MWCFRRDGGKKELSVVLTGAEKGRLAGKIAPHGTVELLTGRVELTPPPWRRIFVNRSLRLDRVEWIGFDMDYTLAPYKSVAMETLAYQKGIEMLVEGGYPEELRSFVYDPQRVVRGVLLDKEEGNLLKVDRHRFVGTAYHGHRPLSKAMRRMYRASRLDFQGDRFYFVDTLFATPEACLYSDLVEFFDRREGEGCVDYRCLFEELRQSMDQAHERGLLQQEVMCAPGRYLERDPDLGWALHRFRMSGKRLFLLTNSGWEYTESVMQYLLDDRDAERPHWQDYLDLVVVQARKPSFFVGSASFETIHQEGCERSRSQPQFPSTLLRGGNQKEFNELLGVEGERVLYVGDHIYGDILRSKKNSSWRTMMVISELEEELQKRQELQEPQSRVEELERRRDHLDAELEYQSILLEELERLSSRKVEMFRQSHWFTLEDQVRNVALRKARDAQQHHQRELLEVLEKLNRLKEELQENFNSNWGMILKEGNEISYLGEQIRSYACLYTGRVTNFLYHSPLHYFRPPRPVLPHEIQQG